MKKRVTVIGVRELRAHLSAYLRTVAREETVTIGDRRRQPIARLVPVETRAALAQSRRAGVLSPTDLRRAVTEFDLAWRGYNAVEIDEALVLRAGSLAEEHGLRGYDAVQLAAALRARRAEDDHRFASFDDRLNEAAAREGLHLASAAGDTVADRPAIAYRAQSRPANRVRVAASGQSR